MDAIYSAVIKKEVNKKNSIEEIFVVVVGDSVCHEQCSLFFPLYPHTNMHTRCKWIFFCCRNISHLNFKNLNFFSKEKNNKCSDKQHHFGCHFFSKRKLLFIQHHHHHHYAESYRQKNWIICCCFSRFWNIINFSLYFRFILTFLNRKQKMLLGCCLSFHHHHCFLCFQFLNP